MNGLGRVVTIYELDMQIDYNKNFEIKMIKNRDAV